MQPCVHDDKTRESLGHLCVLSEPSGAAPILHEQRDVLKIEMLHEASDVRRVSFDVVPLGVSHLVRLTKTDVVGRNTAVTSSMKRGDHVAIEVTP